MGRLIPGRIRQEGIQLYEDGQLEVKQIANEQLFVVVDSAEVCYTLEDSHLSCSCAFFSKKGYCSHLAAVEYFLKNDATGKELDKQLSIEKERVVEKDHKWDIGSQLLDDLLEEKQETTLVYSISAEGQLLPFHHQIDWTLKLRRSPDTRTYIIRDIGAFLQTLKKNGYYSIGKRYYEPISFQQFDAASQELLAFLWRLVPDKQFGEVDVLPQYGRYLRLPLANFEEGIELLMQLESFVLEEDGRQYTQLQFFPLSEESNCFTFEVVSHPQMIELQIREHVMRELFQGRYLLVDNRLYYVNQKQEQLIARLKRIELVETGIRRVVFAPNEQERLALTLVELQTIGTVRAPKSFIIHDFYPLFTFSVEENEQLALQMTLKFKDREVASQEELASLPYSYHFQQLARIRHFMQKVGFRGDFVAYHAPLKPQDWYHFFTEILPRFQQLGEVRLEDTVNNKRIEASPTIAVELKGSLLDISFDFVGIDDEEIEQAVLALLGEASYFTTRTGKVVLFDENTKQVSRTLADLRGTVTSSGHVTLPKLASYQLSRTWEGEQAVRFSKNFQQFAYDLTHPEAFEIPNIPLNKPLRDYQCLGVKWLSMLDHYGLGGILADDMGLGKTLQTIAFLSSRLQTDGRVLILAPSSLVYNWQSEFQTFAPHLDVAVVCGSKETREQQLSKAPQIVITSYQSFRQDILFHRDGWYDYLILDEAQMIKNAQSKLAQLLRTFEVGNCFALSGTPIENRLLELWSIFQIVLPGLLPIKTKFTKLPAETVAHLIKPFILRRKKEDVLSELPDLREINHINELADEQKVLYLAQLNQMKSSILDASDAAIQQKKIEILAGITRLRQICDTPELFLDDYQGPSGKLESLMDLLRQLKEGGHRVLVFSQFRSMLEIIERELVSLGLTSYLLTGSTPSHLRHEMTTDFNAGKRDVFLISLKAGGVGLNLTGADSVILVDLWWNPAVEAQAISRAHRMGQKKKVNCYRLITRGTIEERIVALQENKKHLVTTVLDGNESRASLTVEDIRDILGIPSKKNRS